MVEIAMFSYEHLDAVLALASAEGWSSLPAHPQRALRALSAPGVNTVVALDEGRVVGFAQMLGDGEIQAYLALLVVAVDRRGEGIGHLPTVAATARAGATRVDLLSASEATGFFESFSHRSIAGYRIYPAIEGSSRKDGREDRDRRYDSAAPHCITA